MNSEGAIGLEATGVRDGKLYFMKSRKDPWALDLVPWLMCQFIRLRRIRCGLYNGAAPPKGDGDCRYARSSGREACSRRVEGDRRNRGGSERRTRRLQIRSKWRPRGLVRGERRAIAGVGAEVNDGADRRLDPEGEKKLIGWRRMTSSGSGGVHVTS